ncbi:Uncharacterized protein DAT39_017017, partial [Clarias magur]
MTHEEVTKGTAWGSGQARTQRISGNSAEKNKWRNIGWERESEKGKEDREQ